MTQKQRPQLTYEIPSTPNFILVRGRVDLSIPIADVPDADLRKIGAAWTERLVEKAQQRRKAATK